MYSILLYFVVHINNVYTFSYNVRCGRNTNLIKVTLVKNKIKNYLVESLSTTVM